ncbi:SymE family type I addiction module toxin [Culturomica massiliensis]|uniref:SymE family type I addiction module toxin n=1 Tax=Culturomica massiliensis TaxID=1841857 RepID=UPI0026650D81|nr:SymE family type I addiction module toxin [Culturomica massiliensis]
MTILRGYRELRYDTKEVPYVLLKGNWMYEAGFRPGDKIIITVQDGKLLISKREQVI